MTLKSYNGVFVFSLIIAIFFIAFTQSSCKVSYGFQDAKSIPDSLKIVKINQITNKASYVNPSLAPALTDRLIQKVLRQTRLQQTRGDDAQWVIDCAITSYTISTAGISNQQVNANRLNVGVNIVIRDNMTQKIIGKYDVSTPFDYAGSLSLQQAEQSLLDQMLRDIPDAIFNRIFSNW
ncbi:LptE family protein [Niabella ginsengisoli]|uniref:LPS assembly lipoprotein LptE n=1 Tax=Niabella ginsengisoli TaxID=522298 RepID=A0ABS9SH47_9BACT|nr:LptE family protein [Niabella ginsengisoli]MCH5597660.1 LPS assembly lipoprotein LptE [Niabella ginsengisoli]